MRLSNIEPTQAAKGVIASQDTILSTLERIKDFFGRLEQYTEVPKLEALKDIIVKMMVEVLGVFAIMMKEMKQGRMGESNPHDTFSVTDRELEKYLTKFLKKLMRRKDRIEAALSEMDRLTGQEVATAIAQIRIAVDRVEQGVEGARREIVEVGGQVNWLIEGTFSASTHKCHLKPTYY